MNLKIHNIKKYYKIVFYVLLIKSIINTVDFYLEVRYYIYELVATN